MLDLFVVCGVIITETQMQISNSDSNLMEEFRI